MKLIAINTLHDATVSVFHDGTLINLELERLVRERYLSLSKRSDIAEIFVRTIDLLEKHYRISNCFETCLYHGRRKHQALIKELFHAASHEKIDIHHQAHAAAALYESPFKEAIIVSFDGGGFDGVFNIYSGQRGANLRLEARFPYNLGTSYRLFAYPLSEMAKKRRPHHATAMDMSAAGKLMGLAAYGQPREGWIGKIIGLMKCFDADGDLRKPGVLLQQAGLPSGFDELSGQNAYDLAASAQRAFEEVFFEVALPYLQSSELPICLTGGAALNVLLNERVRKATGRDVFVPPNPNDCGITTGLILDRIRPEQPVNVTYSGWPLLDRSGETLGQRARLENIVQLLTEGKIIGVARGGSEHGPRALGNRSIICDPGIRGMKNILNHKVKFREWFRPFAPVTRLESAKKYFDLSQPAPYMSFAPTVREQWRSKLAAIVHQDGTARVQTVTELENPWLYRLLGEFEKASGYDVLLNTSFNMKGRPILTSISDAVDTLRSTSLDFAVIEDHLISKKDAH
ncbi:MAG: hypothetical protein L0Z50_38235 [Verrucomicrobiales bacterium]|nr:hypothetical protein [Verrucomicrobiales bacterium]